MARTAITVDTLAAYAQGSALSVVTGDAANDHEVNGTAAPKLHLFARNTAGNTIAFTIVHNPDGHSHFRGAAFSTSVSIGAFQRHVIVLDMPSDMLQSGGLIHIDSADANFAELRFYAYTWQDSPGGNTGYAG